MQADGMANSVDPDQTAPLGKLRIITVWPIHYYPFIGLIWLKLNMTETAVQHKSLLLFFWVCGLADQGYTNDQIAHQPNNGIR